MGEVKANVNREFRAHVSSLSHRRRAPLRILAGRVQMSFCCGRVRG